MQQDGDSDSDSDGGGLCGEGGESSEGDGGCRVS